MGLVDLISFGAEKAYGKYKESKMESAMDQLLASFDSCALALDVYPLVSGEDINMIKGKVYKFEQSKMAGAATPYFLSSSDWLMKAGIDINNDKIYEAALHEKGGHAYLDLLKKVPNVAGNYNNEHNQKTAITSLFIYIPEEKAIIYTPKFIIDKKTQKIVLAKSTGSDKFDKLNDIKTQNPDSYKKFLSSNYMRARLFAYKLTDELEGYDKTNLDNSLSKFEEKHGKNSEIVYNF